MPSGIFSFNETAVNAVLGMIPSIVPGVEKIISVYYSPVLQSLKASVLLNQEEDSKVEDFNISDTRSVMNRFRTESADYTWLQKSDLPFESPVKAKIQLDIFNELEINILLIRIQNSHDYLNDLFFVYLNPSAGAFGFSGSKGFTQDNRAVIANLLRNSILFSLNRMKEDRELFLHLRENQDMVVQEMTGLKAENIRIREKYRDGILKLSYHHLHDLATKNSRHYVLSKEAENRILEYPGSLPDLGEVLEKAARLAEISALDPYNTIEIADHHLVFTEKPAKSQKKKEEEFTNVPVRYSKTLLLLNKLETAAKNIKARNEVLTSLSLGNELPVRITPPAISDAVKKHRSKIIHLLNEYPQRWEIIRSEFRPIRNILTVKDNPEQKTA